jgi:DNA-dependent RNA polymerase auxiliary subunit epsilon
MKLDVKVTNIKRVSYFILECWEHSLVSYGDSIGIDMYKAFAFAWDFDFKLPIDQDGVQVSTSLIDSMSSKEAYEKYNGIIIKRKQVNSSNEVIKAIRENLQVGLPTIIHMDTYYSYWGLLYKQVHTGHIAIANGLEEDSKQLWIVDPDHSPDAFLIDYSLLDSTTSFYLEIDSLGDAYSYEELLHMLQSSRVAYEYKFKRMEEFARFFKENFSPSNEFTNALDLDSVVHSELILKLRNIVKGRNLFITFLEKLKDDYSGISQTIECLYISMGKWNTIMNLMFKASCFKWRDDFNEKVYLILCSIIEIEREALEFLLSAAPCKASQTSQAASAKYLMQSVDISALCNNKGFAFDSESVPIACDLTGSGEYIVLEERFPQITDHNTVFHTCFTHPYDNISCNGEELDINASGAVCTIELLLCAEWGDCEDSITIVYEDSTRNNCKIVVNDISNATVSDTNVSHTIRVGSSRLCSGKEINSSVYLTHTSVQVRPGSKIAKIKLPYNSNLHILAITIMS